MSTKSPFYPSDEQFLDAVYARIFEQVEDGQQPLIQDFLGERPHLKEEIIRLIEMATEVAIAPSRHRPELADFEIVSELGRGGMGAVYLARQLRAGGRLVALKILQQHAVPSEKARDRFVHEANALAKLRHPHIVTVHDVILDHGVSAYAMEWIDGKPLSQLIEHLRSLKAPASGRSGVDDDSSTTSETIKTPSMKHVADFLGASPDALRESSYTVFMCRIIIAIARALAEVHRSGLTHRDVKPSNILLRRDGTALLTDFGLVRQPDSAVVTQTGHFVGTLAYAAPEQLHGDHSAVGPRSDAYSLGVTLYHALTLQLPFTGKSPGELLSHIEGGRLAPMRKFCRDLPRDLETIISKTLDPDPTRRYATTDELADDLECLLNLQPIKAKPATLITRVFKAARRNRASLLGAIVGSILALSLTAAAATYFLVFPRWADRYVSNARLELLHPEQGNQIYSVMFWNVPVGDQSLVSPNALQKALRHYDAAIRLQPWNENIDGEREAVSLAMTEISRRQTEKGSISSDSHCTPDQSIAVSDKLSLRSRGLIAFLVGDPLEALDTWSAIDPLEAADPLVEAAMGMLHLANSEPARAYPCLQNAVNSFHGVSFLTMYLADAAIQCGDINKAAKLIDRAKREPFQDIQNGLGRLQANLLAAQGHNQEAESAYLKLATPVAQLDYARFLESCGRLEEAALKYADVASAVPRSRLAAKSFLDALHEWWELLPPSSKYKAVRLCLEPEKARRAELVTLLSAYLIANKAIAKPKQEAVHQGFLQKYSSSRFSRTLGQSRSASYLQRDDVSLATLAGRMEVANVERWNYLRRLPPVLKCWLAQSWLSPHTSLKGRIAEHWANALCKLDAALAELRRPATSARQTMKAYSRTSMRTLALPALVTVAAVQGPVLAGPADPYWAERCVSGPSGRQAVMVYDSARDVHVLFGGYVTGPLDDTWEWNGDAWTHRVVSGPSPRYNNHMAYDSTRGVTVVFGGSGSPGVLLGDTWEWDGVNWLMRATTGPAIRESHAMAFDSQRNVTVLFGGLVNFNYDVPDTWEWDGNSWTHRTSGGPHARVSSMMAYDPSRGVSVLFGGVHPPSGMVFGDTWEWDGNSWTLHATTGPSPRVAGRLIYDSQRARIILFGGSDSPTTTRFNDMWEWDGTSWTQITGVMPEVRRYQAMTYDSARDRIVLFGGLDDPSLLSDTWEFGSVTADPDQDLIPDQHDSCPDTYNPCQPSIGFYGLGDLPGGAAGSEAYAVSADGTTVVGHSWSANSSTSYVGEAFRWRLDTGIVGLGDLPGNHFMSVAQGVSADGSVIAGRSSSSNGNRPEAYFQEAFKWTEAEGMVGLGDLPGHFFCSDAYDVSADGNIIAGQTHPNSYERATIWTNGSGWGSPTETTPDHYSTFFDISGDGIWATGHFYFPTQATRWSAATGFEILGELPGGGSYAAGSGISDDGNSVVGQSDSGFGPEAFRWTEATGMIGLGDLSGGSFNSNAAEILPDGSLIVGRGTSPSGSEAVLWDESLALHRVVDVLASNGVAVPCGWTLTDARDITLNCGVVTIAGNGSNPNGETEGWIASYFPGSPPVSPLACDDGNACTINDICTGVVCAGTPPRPWGDITPADCDPVVSGCNVVNIDDILCVLSAFAGTYICAGGLAFADIVPCAGNGVINLDDILGVLNAFTGANACPCVP